MKSSIKTLTASEKARLAESPSTESPWKQWDRT